MKTTLQNLNYRLANLSRFHKRLIMVIADLIALPLALLSGFALRFAQWWPQPYLSSYWWLFVITPLIGVYIFARLGLYRAVVRFMGMQALTSVFVGVCLLVLLMFMGVAAYGLDGFPRSVLINFALVALIYVGGTRVVFRSYYHWLVNQYAKKQPVLVYGAGGAGVQLTASLIAGNEFHNVAFIDDNPALWRSVIQGVRVYGPDQIPALVKKYRVKHVLLALPNATNSQRKQALDRFTGMAIKVLTVPVIADIVSGVAQVDQLRQVEVEDLLGRDPVPPHPDLLQTSIKDKVVLVTGAGGSIGSELCRQIIRLQPTRLLLLDISEYSLYAIEQELAQIQKQEELSVPVLSLLGSVVDSARLDAILAYYNVQTIYHAAAYKHVPMVEHNIFQGIQNNVFGTQAVALAALKAGVERCVLVSTDKAVRPTNVMGATKRLAELVVQDLATQVALSKGTIFSMVRFGNVLGSSGSVVPLFKRQIAEGGPVTVTHPDITRYFMTIPEAALLVIQAGSMAQGGEVFVLDMGESVRIVDLAARMIELSGLELKTESNPDGDIAIAFSGLRPGEKLYEELLIGGDVTATTHPKIMCAQEEKLSSDQVASFLLQLQSAHQAMDQQRARDILEQAVSGFKPSSELCDHLYSPFNQPALYMTSPATAMVN